MNKNIHINENILSIERRQKILSILQSDKKVIVSQLSVQFSVSDETIRRDLAHLCKEGLAIKSYGVAILNEDGPDLPFYVRKMHQLTEKQKIAQLVQKLVNDGDSIMLDASTTAVFAAKALKEKKRLTVITNSMEVLVTLADKPDWTIISTGGHLVGDYLAFAGSRTVSDIPSFYVDKLIFSCKGVDIKRGITESNDDFSQVKRAMIKSAKTKILAVDASKIDRTAFFKVADISDIDILVTDTSPGDRWIDCLTGLDVNCIF